ncbi:MAG: LysM peptidoglycan-binding domain-containing protein [Roseovarius indicus]
MKRITPRATLAAVALTAGAGMASAQGACGTSYAIEPGDTLYKVSQRCNVGLTRIMELNPNVNARDLSVGQSIRLARGTRADGETGTDYRNGTRRGSETYRVGRGETLYSIAQAVGVSVIELLNANGSIDPTDLAVGDVIDVPTDTPSAAVRITPESGPPETQVTLRARNLRPNDWVTIGAGRASSEWRAIGQARADGQGDISADVGLPDWADPGDSLIYVLDTDRA